MTVPTPVADPVERVARVLARVALLRAEFSTLAAHLVDAQARAETAEAKLAEVRDVLREFEWADEDFGGHRFCRLCGQAEQDGHMTDCRARAALSDMADGEKL